MEGRTQDVFMENGHLYPLLASVLENRAGRLKFLRLWKSPWLLEWRNEEASAISDVLFCHVTGGRRWGGRGGAGGEQAGNSHKPSLCKDHLSDFSTVIISIVPEGPKLPPVLQRDKMAPQDHMMQDKSQGAEFSLGPMIFGESLTF